MEQKLPGSGHQSQDWDSTCYLSILSPYYQLLISSSKTIVLCNVAVRIREPFEIVRAR